MNINENNILFIPQINLGIAVLSAISFYLYGFTTILLFFDAGGDLLFWPIVLLINLVIAVLAWKKVKIKSTWYLIAVITSAIMFILWVSMLILFYLAYSNCPNGVC